MDKKNDLKNSKHKPGVKSSDWDEVDPDLILIAWDVRKICIERKIPFLISGIIRPKIVGVSETDIHAEKRAVDFSVIGWTVDDIDEVLITVNRLHSSRGAFKPGDPTPRAIIYEHKREKGPDIDNDSEAGKFEKENNAEPHLHAQCKKKI